MARPIGVGYILSGATEELNLRELWRALMRRKLLLVATIGVKRASLNAAILPRLPPQRRAAPALQLHALAYNLANFIRTLALPKEVEHWSLTTCARSS